jgi:ATP-dependent DNA helicase RecG
VAAAPARIAPGAPVRELGGIGPKTAAKLAATGIATVLDLLATFAGRCVVKSARRVFLPGRRAMVTVVFDAAGGGAFDVLFFNQPWLKDAYSSGEARVVEGTLQKKGKRFVVHGGRVLPRGADAHGAVQLRYPEIDGVAATKLAHWIGSALDRVDWAAVRLAPLPTALRDLDFDARSLFFAMHRPANVAEHECARRRFAVAEAVAMFAKVAAARARREGRSAEPFAVDDAIRRRILARLPFALTDEQRAAAETIWHKLRGPSPMGALLQGDVGTGKTAVAVAAALAVVARGAQVAFLSPTELLAEQHCLAVSAWLEGSGVTTQLLTGSVDARARKQLAALMRQPAPRIWFGTHALFSDDVAFARLGLVVVDEQHRFGVEQRMRLVQKGEDPHVLVMTATPIPRTLALSLFGDLDLVSLRERPHGRPLPRAVHAPAEEWPRVVRSIARAVRRNGRVYVVCPAVGEEGKKGSAVRLFESLQGTFRCRLVHGRMSASEQQAALSAFRRGDCDVLVGTTVLEVGVDVPDATLMVVVQADRFGLATLHQLRGRVGRGARRGVCVLCGPKTDRVAAIASTTDGFELAEIDLRLRGIGELLGTQQSGFGDLRALDPVEDFDLLQRVRKSVDGALA